jgi:hypothetical protein
MALGGWALGGVAAGYSAYGGAALAWLASQGGCSIAHDFAVGGTVFAHHANDEAARLFFQTSTFFNQVTTLMRYAIFVIWLPVGLMFWQMFRLRRERQAVANWP